VVPAFALLAETMIKAVATLQKPYIRSTENEKKIFVSLAIENY
jgi:hypothetical protein